MKLYDYVVLSVVVCNMVALRPAKGKIPGFSTFSSRDLVVPGEGGQADDCTNGFMSLERMSQVIENHASGATWNRQVVIPEINFTCNGSVQTLMFGTSLRTGDSYTEYPEFQIWRPLEGGNNYEFVGKISVGGQQQVSGQMYQFQGESLLQFEAGDILGFYQPARDYSRSQLRLAVRMPQPVQIVYRRNNNSEDNFDISNIVGWRRNLLVSVMTG